MKTGSFFSTAVTEVRDAIPLFTSAISTPQIDDLCGRPVAEELAQGSFVIGDAVAVHQSDEIARGVAAERGNTELRILRQEMLGRGLAVCEVASPPTQMRIFLPADSACSTTSTDRPRLASLSRAHHAGSARADDHDVH